METKKAAEAATVEKQGKDIHFFQLQQTQLSFYEKPKTMMMVAREIGVDRANICWFMRDLRTNGAVWKIRVGRCPITRAEGVGFWSTNPKYAEGLPKQLELFPL